MSAMYYITDVENNTFCMFVCSYQLSETGLWWRELVNNISCAKDIICKPKEGKSSMFVVRVSKLYPY